MTYTFECPECGAESEFEFIPGEPVKFCLDHDDPEFSNPGSGDELNGPERCEVCQETIDQDKVMELAREDVEYSGPDTESERCGRGDD